MPAPTLRLAFFVVEEWATNLVSGTSKRRSLMPHFRCGSVCGLEQTCADVCVARVSLCQHGRHSERSSARAGSSCPGTDSLPRRSFRGCLAALADGEVAQRDGFHHLRADARDLCYTVLGLAVLEPLLGPTSGGAVGLVALAINLTVPPAVVLLEMDAAAKNQQVATNRSKPSAIVTGLNAGLKSPLLWAPILGITVVLLNIRLPAVLASCFELIGSATSGVAVFAVGLVLAAHPVRLSRAVLVKTLGRVTVQSAVLFALLHLLHVVSPFAREALVCCSFPLATVVVLFAARYKAVESEAASMLLVSTLALLITVPTILWLSH